jgi:hypothetical protein
MPAHSRRQDVKAVAMSEPDEQDLVAVSGRWRFWRRLRGLWTWPARPIAAGGEEAPDDRPMVISGRLHALKPEEISGLLGRRQGTSFLAAMKPRTRFILIGLAAAVLVVILAIIDKGLTNPKGVRTAIGLIVNPEPRPRHISLALLQDPVGIIALIVTLFTPTRLGSRSWIRSKRVALTTGFLAGRERICALISGP